MIIRLFIHVGPGPKHQNGCGTAGDHVAMGDLSTSYTGSPNDSRTYRFFFVTLGCICTSYRFYEHKAHNVSSTHYSMLPFYLKYSVLD